MNSLLLTKVFPPETGGSGRWFWEIYSRLSREEYLIVADEHPEQIKFDEHHDLQVIRVPMRFRSWGLLSWQGFRDHWRLLRRVKRIVREQDIRMLHCGKCLPEGLTALLLHARRGIPFLCYVHGEELNLALTSRELRWWTRKVLRGAAVLIANSKNTAKLLRDDWRVPAEQIQVLNPGVDTIRFVPAQRNMATRARLGWGARPVVLTVGRLQKRKGQDQMIRALHAIKQQIPDILYAIVGDGDERQSLHELSAHEGLTGHVQFIGEIDDDRLLECYQQCDLFALPNRQIAQDIEGFGMVLLEAQACGRPVLAGDSGGTSETMRIPQTGRTVSCDGQALLADMVIELLTDQARLEGMGAAGRKWVVERFDWEALTRQAERVFRAAMPTNQGLNAEASLDKPANKEPIASINV